MINPYKATELDTLITEGADLNRVMDDLNANRKLTFRAFLKEALEIAKCTEKRLDEIERLISDATPHIRAFLRRYSKALSDLRHYPSPPENVLRVVRVHGEEETLPEATSEGIRAGELAALAVRICHNRFGDTAFGIVTDRHANAKKYDQTLERLEAIYAEMQEVVCGADLIYDESYPAVLPSQREAGLCKVSFRRASGISPSFGDWPQQLIQDAIANPFDSFKSPKKERAKLRAEKAAA